MKELCFILGIDQRSGTNYLSRLIRMHPKCIVPNTIYEDFIIHNSQLLIEYTNRLYNTWNPSWEVEKQLSKDILLSNFGEAIERFFRLQAPASSLESSSLNVKDSNLQKNDIEYLVTKTPSTEGIDNIFKLFPNAKLILLIRDGRAVVESGVRSFDWDYEKAMQRWDRRARSILNFMERNQTVNNNKFLLIKYEDILNSEKYSLLKIFKFLRLDPEVFDFDKLDTLGVTGSSEVRKRTSSVNWTPVRKTNDFNPLERFNNWDCRKHKRFNWIAGQQMKKLGYPCPPVKGNKLVYTIQNIFIDLLRSFQAKWEQTKKSGLSLFR